MRTSAVLSWITQRSARSLLPLAAGLTLAGAALAFDVDQCAADRAGGDLNCTANDVQITGMRVVGDTSACVGGDTVTLDLEMTVNFGSPDRYDVGIFISNDGKSPQKAKANGGAENCSVSVLPTASPFLDLDGASHGVSTGDTCGDGNKADIGGGTGTGIHYMSNVKVYCQSLTGAGGNLFIPFVVSWDNQASPAGDLCKSNADPVPNTSSKCNSPTVVQGTIAVVVLPKISITDGIRRLYSGNTTTYTVVVKNTTGAAISNAVFKDPAVSGIAVGTVTCSSSSGASCPTGDIKTNMQSSSGITLPTMQPGSTVTFSIPATLTGTPGQTLTNTASVSVGSQSNSDSDTDTIIDSITLLPTSLSENGDKGATVNYTYTLYNYGSQTDTVALSAASSKGWSLSLPASVSVPAGGSTSFTLAVQIPNGASVGTVDTTTITARSGNDTAKIVTATAITTVTAVLTLTPNNAASIAAGSSVWYSHRVQNNDSSRTSVSLTKSFTSGSCTGWTAKLYDSAKDDSLDSPLSLAVNGGYRDFWLKVTAPSTAAVNSSCTVTLSAAYTSGSASTATATDVSTVKNLVLYKDAGYANESYVYPAGNSVYAMGLGVQTTHSYEYRWYDSTNTETCLPRQASTTGTTFPDTCVIPSTGPYGTWTVQIWDNTSNAQFAQVSFYVGPDHVNATYSGTANPPTNTSTTLDLAMHARNHTIPFDPSGNLVKGAATDTEGPLMITVTLSGSAEIESTTLAGAVISGRTVTGKLDATTGTATITIHDAVEETVTVTPASYKGVLYGSTARDEPATLTFKSATGIHHYELDVPTQSVNCAATNVKVTGCSDANTPCTKALTLAGQSATLATSAGTLQQTTLTFLADGTASTTLSYPAAADGSPVTVTLSGETVSGTNPRKCCPGGTSCTQANSCTTTFNKAGFIFSNTKDATGNIDNQVAGVASGTYYLRAVKTSDSTKACEAAMTGTNSVSFAYECLNPSACSGSDLMSINGSTTILRNDSGNVTRYQPVSLTFDGNGNAPFTLNYLDVGQVRLWASRAAGATPAGTLLSALTGSSNSFIVKPYQLALSGIRCTTANAANCGPGALAMPTSGDNPAAADAAGGAFIRAGDPFSVTVTAQTLGGAATPNFGKETPPEWVALNGTLAGGLGLAAQDPSLNLGLGRRTTGSMVAGNNVLTVASSQGFAVNERVSVAGAGAGGTALVATITSVPDTRTLALDTNAAVAVGGAAVNATFPAFSAGGATGTDFTWNDVGIITLTASIGDGDYLGAGNVQTTSGKVGRFYPHHFGVSGAFVPRSDLADGAGSTFTYMGEPMKLTATVTAFNANEAATPNYSGNFAKLDAATLGGATANWICTAGIQCMGLGAVSGSNRSARLAIDTTSPNSAAPVNMTTAGGATPGWSAGSSSFTFFMAFNRDPGGPDGPYNGAAPLSIGAKPLDSDGVTLPPRLSSDAAHCVDLDLSNGTRNAACNPGPTETNLRRWLFDTDVRYGRIRLFNANGSELLALPVPMRIEYWAGAALGWIANPDDALTAGHMTAGMFAFSFTGAGNKLTACKTAITGALAAGPTLTAPGLGFDGWADLTLNLGTAATGNQCTAVGTASPAATTLNAPWLQYNWTSGAAGNPTARARFGGYRTGPVIHRRELY